MIRATRDARVAALALVLASTAGAQPVPEAARGADRTPKRWILAAAGGIALGAMGLVYGRSGTTSQAGNCTSPDCVTGVAFASGALVGYLIGRELDQLHVLRYRGQSALKPRIDVVSLGFEVTGLAARDSLIAASGRPGVRLITSGLVFRPGTLRAGGIRGITDLALDGASTRLAITTPTGVYVYPVASGPGAMIRDGAAGLAVGIGDTLVFATVARLQRAPFAADTLREWPGVDVGRPITALAEDSRGLVWATADSMLSAVRFTGDSLEVVSSLPVPGRPRRLVARNGVVAVAMGEDGVLVVDATDPARPAVVTRWSGTRFAYDVSLAPDRLFVGGGPDGLYVLGITGTDIRPLGLARDLGFAAVVVSRGSYTYVFDRNTSSLRRIRSDF